MESYQQKMSKEEVKKWVAIGCVAIGAIAVKAAMTAPAATATTTIYAGQKFLRDNDGLFRIVNGRRVYDVFMGPEGGLYRVVNGLKRYDVAGKVFRCFCA